LISTGSDIMGCAAKPAAVIRNQARCINRPTIKSFCVWNFCQR
jgi:hypothetical protein